MSVSDGDLFSSSVQSNQFIKTMWMITLCRRDYNTMDSLDKREENSDLQTPMYLHQSIPSIILSIFLNFKDILTITMQAVKIPWLLVQELEK